MTALQTVNYIRLLLDDTTDWHTTTEELVNAVNDAQNLIIKHYYVENNDIPLRPLYRYSDIISNGAAVISQNDERYLLYPRACRVFYNIETPQASVFAVYKEPLMFDAYIEPSILTGSRLPRQIIYTIKHEYDNVIQRLIPRVYLSEPLLQCQLLFIAEPKQFTFNRLTRQGQALEIDDEYHIEVAHVAADILIDMDIEEAQRDVSVSLDVVPGKKE